MSILRIKKVNKHFGGVYAVNNLSLCFEEGEVVSVIGPNGSGKTTLVNLLTGMVPLDSGVVVMSEVSLEKLCPWDIVSFRMTRTFQSVRLFEQMSVLDNVLVVLTDRSVLSSLFERCSERHLKECEELLKKVGLWEKRKSPASDLSYGQRKLLEIARALAMRSDL